MPIPLKVAITFTPAEIVAMGDAAKLINDIIKSKIEFNMSNNERKSLSKIGDARLPYVLRAINDFGSTYPHLNGPAVPIANAAKDLATYSEMEALENLVKQAVERVGELKMAAGHFAWKFTRKQYEQAESNKDENVEGAQVVYDAQKGAFAGQGPTNYTSMRS